LGEISPNEFEGFIGEDIHLEPVMLQDNTSINDILSYYMGKNTPARQTFIIDNLKIEIDEISPDKEVMDLDEKPAVTEPKINTAKIAEEILG
jgi:topoisomerase-4 subunit B